MFEKLKNAIISNGWKFPTDEIKAYHAMTTSGGSGVVTTKHYGKIYYYIIQPWEMCPDGKITIERA